MSLFELFRAYRDGDRRVQMALLDEVEPLLFGYARSLVPSGEGAFERAVRATHALVIGFHLRAKAGRLEIADLRRLRGVAHGMVVAKLAADEVPLGAVADQESNSMLPTILDVGARIEGELDERGRDVLAAKLLGERCDESAWARVRDRMIRCGVLA